MRTAALGTLLAIVIGGAWSLAAAPAKPSREMAVTFDDLPGVVAPGEGTAELREITEKLVRTIASEKIPAVGFVNEGKLAPAGSRDPERVALLGKWICAGLDLGNHTYSHLDLHKAPLDQFEKDVVAGEEVTAGLLSSAHRRLRYFRHPFLHTGRSLETRKALEEFLSGRGYRVAPVTLDNSDWVFARAYALAKQRRRPRRRGEGGRGVRPVHARQDRVLRAAIGQALLPGDSPDPARARQRLERRSFLGPRRGAPRPRLRVLLARQRARGPRLRFRRHLHGSRRHHLASPLGD